MLLTSFVPMFFVATAFYYMNRADQDRGTTFSWVTGAMGPWLGWIGGWAICVTGILVVGSPADVAARYTYIFFGPDGLAGSKLAITSFAVVIIVAMTALCVTRERRFRPSALSLRLSRLMEGPVAPFWRCCYTDLIPVL